MRLIRLMTILTSFILLTTSITLVMSRRGVLENEWLIVFTRSFRNDWFLVTILPNGEAVERPTVLRGQLHWSADDDWVAYMDTSRFDRPLLYRARPNGRERHSLLDFAGNVVGLNWSADGEWLYYTDESPLPTRDLLRVHVERGNQTRLDVYESPYCCQWSPDGEWMLIDRGSSIYRARPDGAELQAVATIEEFDLSYPQFAENGQNIVFSANQVPRINIIYKTDINGEVIEQISHDDYSYLPSVSPDGTQVVFLSAELDTFLTYLYISDIDDPDPQRLTELTDYYYEYDPFNSNLMWSPDGQQIVFLAQHDRQQGLFQVSARGGAVETLYTVPNGKATRPHFLEFPRKDLSGWGYVVVSGGMLVVSLMLQFGVILLMNVNGYWGIRNGGHVGGNAPD